MLVTRILSCLTIKGNIYKSLIK